MLILEKEITRTEKSKNDNRNTVAVSLVLSKYVFKDRDLIRGEKKKLPDIYTSDKSLGIELVNIKLTREHAFGKIARKVFNREVLVTDEKLKKDAAKFGVKIGCLEDGSLRCGISEIIPNFQEVIKSIFKDNLENKLGKLNNGLYDGIDGEMYLSMAHTETPNAEYVVELVAEICKEIASKYKRLFYAVLVVLENSTYKIDSTGSIEKCSYTADDYFECVRQMKEMLEIDNYAK